MGIDKYDFSGAAETSSTAEVSVAESSDEAESDAYLPHVERRKAEDRETAPPVLPRRLGGELGVRGYGHELRGGGLFSPAGLSMDDLPVSNQINIVKPGTAELSPGSPRAEASGAGEKVEVGRFQAERLQDVFENYLHYYAAGESHTARAKRYDLQHFLDFLVERFGAPETILVSDWTMQVTKDFVESRLSRGEAPTTVARRLATIKHLGRTLAERVHGFVNPAREVKGPVVPVARPQGLSPEETSLLREAARREVEEKERSFNALRNQFLLELLLGTGLRADEVRLLTLGQLSEDFEWLKNVKTKGRRYRNVYVSTELRAIFERYVAVREHEIRKRFSGYQQMTPAEKARLPVIVSFHSAALSSPNSFGVAPKTIWRIIAGFSSKAQRIAGTPVHNLHPHRLRHTFAHGLLDSSRDVRLVAQALGHSDVRTTMRYTERSDEDIADAIEGRERSS